MKIEDCNPYLRAAQIQPAVLEGEGARIAYDHRLFYILAGEGTLLLEDRTLPLSPDTLLLWPYGVGYHFRGRLRVAVLNFDLTRAAAHRTVPVCPPPASEFDRALLFDTALLDELEQPMICPDSTHLREDVLELVNTFSKCDPLADATSSALLKRLLAKLLRARTHAPDPTIELIEQVRRHIRLYATEISGNEAVGQTFGYHPVYLAALFKEKTGDTLHRAILAERIALAKQWLVRTNRSIEEIAEGTGFSSRSHFCTAFKRITGISPRRYRTEGP